MSSAARLRIAVVAEGAVWGGIETQLALLLPAAAADPTLEITGLLFSRGELADRLAATGRIAVEVAPESARPARARWLASRIEAFRPDLLHAHGFEAEILAAAIGKIRGLRVLSTVHSDPGRSLQHAPDRGRAASAALWTARRFGAAHLIAVSRDLRHRLVDLGIPSAQVTLVYNGVGVPGPDEKRAAAALRASLGIDERQVAIGMIGRLEPVKGHLRFLHVFSRLHETNPQVVALIAGDGPLRAALDAEADALGIGASVERLGFRSDAGAVMQALDIGVFASSHEGIPFAALEMMRRSVPLVCYGVGGLLEIVEDERTGLLAPPGDEDALLERLESLVEDDSRRHALGAAAASAIERSFSVEAMTATTVELWRELAARG